MPITISYNDFITPTGSMSTEVSTPGSFSPIASNITDLDASDMKIVFTDLPSGLKVALTQDTPTPFDSIYVDLDGYDDYVYMSGNGNYWTGAFMSIKYLPSAGFWGMGNEIGSPGLILTGIGSSGESVLNIPFESIYFNTTTYTSSDLHSTPLYAVRGNKYIIDTTSEAFTGVIFFNQVSNYSWQPIEIVTIGPPSNIIVSGTSYSGSGSYVEFAVGFSGVVKWLNNELFQEENDSLMSNPPTEWSVNFAPEQSVLLNNIYANENFSLYSVLANNSGNTGTAVIQLNSNTINGELFTDLIPPLRKVYVTFTDNP